MRRGLEAYSPPGRPEIRPSWYSLDYNDGINGLSVAPWLNTDVSSFAVQHQTGEKQYELNNHQRFALLGHWRQRLRGNYPQVAGHGFGLRCLSVGYADARPLCKRYIEPLRNRYQNPVGTARYHDLP